MFVVFDLEATYVRAERLTIDHDKVFIVSYGSNDLRVHEERLKEIAEDSEIELIET